MAFEHHLDIRLQFKQQLETTREYIIPFVARHVRVGEGTRVLDIGCGTGGVCMAFAEAGALTLGVDLSDTSIAVAREFCAERAGQMRFLLQNVYEFETDEKFDLIVFKDSIEHIPEQARIIAHVKRYLAPGGKIFFGFPPWFMPFGGHQQVIRNSKFLSLLPYCHLLPKAVYRAMIRAAGESPSIEAFLMETKDLGISTARFERIVRQTGYKITDSVFYLFNPIYRYKFGIRPRKQWKWVKALPFVRDFVTTGVYYLIEPE